MDAETAKTLNRMQKQKTLREIANRDNLPLEEKPADADTATKYRLLKDITLSLPYTGAIRLTAGQVIEDPRMLHELKQAGADLRPIA